MAKSVYFLLIPNDEGTMILFNESERGWQLPYLNSEVHYSECAVHLIKFFEQTYNFKCSILGLLDFQYNEETDTFSFFYLVEANFDNYSIKLNSRFLDKTEIEVLLIRDSDQMTIIRKWFNINGELLNYNNPDWMNKDWLPSVEFWIKHQLANIGIGGITGIEPVKLWYRGYVMKIDTTQGIYYFKAVPKAFLIENYMAIDFASQFSDNSPVIIAEEWNKGWILMECIIGDDLMFAPNEEQWIKTVKAYARVQIQYSNQIEKLIKIGCMDRRLNKLPEMIKKFTTEALCMQPSLFGALSQAEINTFKSIVPKLLDDCRKLEEFGIPASIEHGDLTSRNVKVSDNSVIFFDWSDCSVSHPFFSLRALFGLLEVTFPNNETIQHRLRNAYINEWVNYGYGCAEILNEAFEIAYKLAPMHMSLTYHLHTLPAIERKEECIGAESLFIRWLIDQYEIVK